MTSLSLQSMRAKRLDDAMQGRGYGVPGVLTPAGRSLQVLGAAMALVGAPSGSLSMLAVYEKDGAAHIQRGWLEGTEISGTGRVDLQAGDRVYVRAVVQRQDALWYTGEGSEPVTYRYFTGAYNIVSSEVLVVPAAAPAPSDVFSETGTTARIHKLMYTVPSSGVIPADGSGGRWLRLSQGELLFST